MKPIPALASLLACLLLNACAQAPVAQAPGSGHLMLPTPAADTTPAVPSAPIPAPVSQSFDLPPPRPGPRL
ncbi:MAG: hypothetical protein KDG55_20745, partial [Rhodocyclaceae bacterium]|nr:hypothetical protein [Rhodocyclaceae bacterium]